MHDKRKLKNTFINFLTENGTACYDENPIVTIWKFAGWVDVTLVSSLILKRKTDRV